MNRLTIDVEDYYSLVARDQLGLDLPVSSYVDAELGRLLDLLDEIEVTATCFVVGRLAKERPHLVREVAARGHEIASHGYEHIRMERLSPSHFASDLRASIAALQDIVGAQIDGFRAPAFSLRPEQAWAFEIMAEQGIRYDSSVRCVWPFGRRSAEDMIRRAAASGIREYPGIAVGWRRWRAPLAGGGGMRVMPSSLTRRLIASVERHGFMVPAYVHPYDLWTERYEEGWPSSDWRNRLRLIWFNWTQGVGRSRVAGRMRRLAETDNLRECAPADLALNPGR